MVLNFDRTQEDIRNFLQSEFMKLNASLHDYLDTEKETPKKLLLEDAFKLGFFLTSDVSNNHFKLLEEVYKICTDSGFTSLIMDTASFCTYAVGPEIRKIKLKELLIRELNLRLSLTERSMIQLEEKMIGEQALKKQQETLDEMINYLKELDLTLTRSAKDETFQFINSIYYLGYHRDEVIEYINVMKESLDKEFYSNKIITET